MMIRSIFERTHETPEFKSISCEVQRTKSQLLTDIYRYSLNMESTSFLCRLSTTYFALTLLTIVSVMLIMIMSNDFYISMKIRWDKLGDISGHTQRSTIASFAMDNRTNQLKMQLGSTVSSPRDHTPTILLWQRPFGRKGYGPRPGSHCGCKYTYDRSQAMFSDAVVIYCRDANKKNLPPDFPNRTISQLYIWWCREPPTHVATYPLDMDYRHGFFNWTMTYRRDSDVSTPWDLTGNVKSSLKKRNVTLAELMAAKNKTAIAIVGNCGSYRAPAAKERMKRIKQMQQLMPVDGFGRCFNQRISNEDYSKIVASYKFYISFENSYHCKDYISEKFWLKPLRQGLVPVVWGASPEDYAAVAPKNSYILAEAFNSTEDLVKYLLYLDKNETAYLEYFKWRSLENLRSVTATEIEPPLGSDFSNMCVLCRRLLQRQKGQDLSHSMVGSIKEYFLDSNENGCLHGGENT